jgi:uncharacterized membrane protein
MACKILLNTIRVKGILGKDEVCFLSGAPIGEAISNKNDRIIFFSIDLKEILFTGPAKATLFFGVRKRDIHSSILLEMSAVGIEGNLGEMIDFQYLLDIEIKTIADNFYIEVLFTAILIERLEERIDM